MRIRDWSSDVCSSDLVAGTGWNPPAQAASSRPQAAVVAQADAKDVAVEIREQASGKLKSFYASRGFWPLWASKGTIGPEADALLEFLTTADLDGLKPSSYKVRDLREAIDSARAGDPRSIARAELQLSRAFSRYVSDMRRRSSAKMIFLDAQLKPKKLRTKAVLRAAALPKSFKDYVTSKGWMSPHYRSEEHTSELQSLMRISYAVFCLKKKKYHIQKTYTRPHHNTHT